jgi:tRNA G37 N-methylase Trm5
MKFIRLSDPLISFLYEDEDILAFDKPYGLNPHTNDSKIEHSEFIQDGLIEILEKQLGKKLYIIHRLDQTTTGVIIFGKSPEAAKKYAAFFFDKLVRKTYLFITGSKSSKKSFSIDQDIIHKARELEAKTDFQFLEKSKYFELWQANPLTGRNHQIRIHAKAGEIPILGDDKYGGANFPFICLHNSRIEFPNGLVIKSKAPWYFADLSLLEDLDLTKSLFEADRRFRLYSFDQHQDQSFRLRHMKNQDSNIDHFGGRLVGAKLSRFSEIVKIPVADVIDGDPWISFEGKIKYEIKSESGRISAPFLNQRLQRNWVLENSRGKSVLNLFSHVCGFALSATVGGAASVFSVDANKNTLEAGKRNFQINALDIEKHKFFCRDSVGFIAKAAEKAEKFDLIICDVPAFFRGDKAIFKIENDLDGFLKNCFQCVKPGGQILFSTSFDGFFIDDLRKKILKIQTELNLKNLEINCLQSSLDFELPDQGAQLKSFLLTF